MSSPHITPANPVEAFRLGARANGFCPVPVSSPQMKVKDAGKRPMMDAWETVCLTASHLDIKSWSRTQPRCTNSGILTGSVVGADMDVLDPDLAEKVRTWAEKVFGPTPLRRVGRAPKVLYAYRIAAKIPKKSTPELFLTADVKGPKAQVEILGDGQHFVADGIHPVTGQPYTWEEGTPTTVRFEELPEVTEAQIDEFLAGAQEILRAGGGRTLSEWKKEHKQREDKGLRAAGLKRSDPPSYEMVADALSYINNDFDYHGWIRVGFSIRAALGDAGRDLWETWSDTSAKNVASYTSDKWDELKDPQSITAGTLFYLAKENGWRRPRSGAAQQSRAERREEAHHEADGPAEKDPRPIVFVVNGRTPEAADAVESILIQAGVEVFARSGTLVRPVLATVPAAKGRDTTVVKLRELTAIGLSDLAARVMRFQKFDKRSMAWVDVNPPAEVMATVLEREGQWRFPSVAGVATIPPIRPDGSVLDRPGYDPATRLYVALDENFRLPAIPERPTRDDALRALAVMQNLFREFAFVGDVDRAVALSGLLTAVARPTLDVAPLHVFRAHTAGSGKSYLVDVISAVVSGRRCPVIAAGKTEEETEKRLGSLLLEGASLVSLDNVNGELGGDALCQFVERPLVKVRILGKSEAPETECRSTALATGNNLVLREDMTRRGLICTLDAQEERPELHEYEGDPLGDVLADRGRYVAALYTVVRAYIAAGAPSVCGAIGSYEMWSRMVRAPLVWLGCADPVKSMETAREEDPELGAIRELFAHWRECLDPDKSYTASQLIAEACERTATQRQIEYPSSASNGETATVWEFTRPEFRDLLLRQTVGGSKIDVRSLGTWLSSIKGKVVGDWRLLMKVDAKHGNKYWLAKVGAPVRAMGSAEF